MAIVRPVTKTKIATVSWGIPITDEVNRMTPLVVAPTAWTALTLTNGWVVVGGWQVPQYRKIGDIVYLRGLMQSGTFNSTAATLPAGFRPLTNESFPVARNGEVSYYVQIASSGAIMIPTQTGGGFQSLSGIQFSITA